MKHAITLDQTEIDWQASNQHLTGTINGKPWRAAFVFGSNWNVQRQHGDSLSANEVKAVQLFLEQHTPTFIERVKNRKTKLCKAAFITLLGLGTAATILAIAAKRKKPPL